MDLFFEKGRITFGDEGRPVVHYDIAEDVLFKGYMAPKKKDSFTSHADKVMSYVVASLYNAIQNKSQLECDVEDGFKAQQMVSKILDAL